MGPAHLLQRECAGCASRPDPTGRTGSMAAVITPSPPSPPSLDQPIVVQAPAAAAGANAVARLCDVRKTYFKPDGSIMVEALRGVDITIPRGQYVAIMGASGSGKSTLMNILGCLDRPTKGDYLLDGQNAATMGDEDLSAFRGRKIGFVFQAFNLIPELTIEENVEVPLFYQGLKFRERRDRAVETLNMVGLGNRLGHRP